MISKISRVFIGRINKGEDLLHKLHEVVEKNKIRSGVILVIGALKKVHVGYYDPNKKEYVETISEGAYELTSGLGNISVDKTGKTIIHIHIVAQNYAGKTISGHLLEDNIVGVTAEYMILETTEEIKREYDHETGLYLLEEK